MLDLVYNNGNILAISNMPVKEYSGDWSSYIISIDNILKIYSVSQGYLLLYEEEGSMYGYVLGGKVFLETYKVEKDICAKDFLMNYLNESKSEDTDVSSDFISIMKNLFDIVHTGTRMEERALYFEGEYVYIYSGIVLGRFKGANINITLQDIDVSTLVRYFFDTQGIIHIKDYNKYVLYSCKGREIYIGRRGLKLSDDMKYNHLDVKDKLSVNAEKVRTIVSFLLGIGNNTGIVQLSSENDGLRVICNHKVTEYFSSFKVYGQLLGGGISEIRIPMDVIQTFLKSIN